jgi:Single-strand binding protein family
MSSVNKVILVGNLTRDPELRHTSNKKAAGVPPHCRVGQAGGDVPPVLTEGQESLSGGTVANPLLYRAGQRRKICN